VAILYIFQLHSEVLRFPNSRCWYGTPVLSVSSTRVYDIFKSNHARAAIFPWPISGDRSCNDLGIRSVILAVQRHEIDCLDFNAIKDLRTTLACMPKHEIIRFGANNVPCVAFGSARRDEVSVYLRVSDQTNEESLKVKGPTYKPQGSHWVWTLHLSVRGVSVSGILDNFGLRKLTFLANP